MELGELDGPAVSRRQTTFDRDTTLVPLAEGRFGVTITRDWWVAVGPNGRLVAAILLRAAEAAVADPARFPRTLTVHYVAPPTDGPAELDVTIERAGRAVSFVSVRLQQEGRLRAVGLAALAAPRPEPVTFQHVPALALPPPEDCPLLMESETSATIRDRWACRWALGWLPGHSATPPPEGEIEQGGWLRLSEPRPYDAAVLAAMVDAWIPPLLSRPDLTSSAMPTVELTVHFLEREALGRLPADAWCGVRFVTATAGDGFLTEEGHVWSPDGRLLAHSRQVAILTPVPNGRPTPRLILEPVLEPALEPGGGP